MKRNRTLLLNPDPADGSSGIPISTVPAGIERTSIPAAQALGPVDGDNPLKPFIEKTLAQQPKPTLTLPPPEPPKPAAPPAPTPPPEPPKPVAPPAPAAPAKIKIAGQEYTEAELAQVLAAQQQAALQAQQQQAPQNPQQPPAAQGPTPEQIAQAEAQFVKHHAAEFKGVQVDETLLGTILEGGKEGAGALQQLLAQTFAQGLLNARKSIYGDLNQEFQSIAQSIQDTRALVQPVYQNHQQLERYQAKQEFVTVFPEFAPHAQLAEQVAEQLLVQYPQQCQQMTREQFFKEVARQADMVMTERVKPFRADGNWRALTPGAAPATATEAIAQAQAQQQPPAPPAAPTPPPVAPPSANPPAATGPQAKSSFAKQVSQSLRDA